MGEFVNFGPNSPILAGCPKPKQIWVKHGSSAARCKSIQMDLSNSVQAADPLPRLAVAIDDASKVVGVSRTRIFEAVRSKEITVRKAGRSSIIEIAELQRWINSLPTKGRQPDTATTQSLRKVRKDD
jgi:hypothetical protein